MKIDALTNISFKRRLKPSEEADYSDTLKRAKEKAAHGDGKSILIVPAQSLPQKFDNNTGVGNLASEEADKFFDFAKKYWGINEVQILPIGQYHIHKDNYPIYSGTSMDLGNHVINLKDFLSEEDFTKVVSSNKIKDKINYSNIVDKNSASELALKNLYSNMGPELKNEFNTYKSEFADLLEFKSLFRALEEHYGTSNYKKWNNIDKNLFNEDIIQITERNKRIAEIKKSMAESIDFYKFKSFLADKSLKKAKDNLNSKGLKLNGDMLFGFSYDEIWAYPKAFIPNAKIKRWGFPVLDEKSPDAEKILRDRIKLYAKRFDGFRIDAAWAYITPNIINTADRTENKLNNSTKFIDIIEDEAQKVMGTNYNKNNLTYEFAADPYKEFNIYEGFHLKPCVRDRVKIYTSEHLSDEWETAVNFIENRGWNDDKFIIGAVNHDSNLMEPSQTQINTLSKILKIPKEKLKNKTEFIKAKFAEPMRAKNNMLFFLPALGLDIQYKNHKDKSLNYVASIPENYEKQYFNALERGKAFNPMDALEKQFKAQGLDKTEQELYKKIVKYKKILEKKEASAHWHPIFLIASASLLTIIGLYKLFNYSKSQSSSK